MGKCMTRSIKAGCLQAALTVSCCAQFSEMTNANKPSLDAGGTPLDHISPPLIMLCEASLGFSDNRPKKPGFDEVY